MPQPVAWFRVIKASRALTKTAAAVWDEYRFRDNGDGAWPHVATVAAHCGLSPRTVEGIREDLKRLGLIQPERRGTKTHWHVHLLDGTYPSTQRPTDQEVLACAARLDTRLQELAAGRGLASVTAPTTPASGPDPFPSRPL